MFAGCGDCVLASGLAGNVVLVSWFCGGWLFWGLAVGGFLVAFVSCGLV